MIVLDADVIIGHLDSADAHHGAASELLIGLEGEPLGVSVLTLAEVLVAPTRAGRLEDARRALRRLDLRPIPIGDDAGHRLAALRAETGLRLPDCCVLLAAQDVDGSVRSFDERLSRAARSLGLR